MRAIFCYILLLFFPFVGYAQIGDAEIESAPKENKSTKLSFPQRNECTGLYLNKDIRGKRSAFNFNDKIYPRRRNNKTGLYPSKHIRSKGTQFDFNHIIYLRKRSEPLFALKTNLLYDAASILNVELEVPIGRHYSVCAEYIGPWWIDDNGTPESNRNRLQITMGTLEYRYWYGSRLSHRVKPLTGFFTGTYTTYGRYDLEYHAKGIQSKNTWGGGVTYGFAHKINLRGSLRMEYSIGVGYLQTVYKQYTAEYLPNENEWRAYRDATQRFNWVGPTRCKISLVWMISGNKIGLYRE